MVKRRCKSPKFDVIVCCQGQPFHYYHSTLIGALIEYGYQYLAKRKYETMNFSLKQVFNPYEGQTESDSNKINLEEVKEMFKKSIDATDNMNQAIESLIQSVYLKGYNDALKYTLCSGSIK